MTFLRHCFDTADLRITPPDFLIIIASYAAYTHAADACRDFAMPISMSF